jgi:CubicO group peptidase (beta-lactamase class C family)
MIKVQPEAGIRMRSLHRGQCASLSKMEKRLRTSALGRRMRAFLVLLVVCSAPGSADQIDDYIKARMAKENIPGVALAVVKDGKVERVGAYGYANVEWKAPVTVDSVFEIGSITKSFTATAVMMLVAEGRISLDQRIGFYISDLPDAWGTISIRQLLSHTSGIKDYVTNTVRLIRDVREPRDTLKIVASAPFQFPPGTRAEYSSTNYVLLGLLIEKVSGKSYADFLSERIIQPLGMTHTCVNDPGAVIAGRAQGYQWKTGQLWNQPAITEAAAFSAGALVSTVGDLAKFDQALYTDRLLKPDLRELMWTPAKLADGSSPGVIMFATYGLGWGLDEHAGHRCVWHGGKSAGFTAAFQRFPEDRLTVIVLTNLVSGSADRLAFAAAAVTNPALGLFALDAISPQRDDQPDLTQRVRAYLVDFIANNGKDLAIMTPELIKDIRPNERADQAFKIRDIKSFTFVAREDVSKRKMSRIGAAVAEVRYCRLINPQGTFLFTFWMTAGGKVADWIGMKE